MNAKSGPRSGKYGGFVVAALLATSLALQLPAADAAETSFPHRPITLVVPFPAGGSTDISTRLLAREMEKDLGQPVIVENRSGSAGTLGINLVAKSPPDGHTLGIAGSGPAVLLNLIGQNVAYEPLKDLSFVARQNIVDFVFVTRNDASFGDIRELIDHARSASSPLSIGNSGTNGPAHLASELLASSAGFKMLPVPYKGESPLLADVIGGHVDVGLVTVTGASSTIKAGKVKALGVAGSARSIVFPQLPTVADSGVEKYAARAWQVIVAPAGTPDDIVMRLNEAINRALSNPELKEKYAAYGMEVVGGTPAEARAFVVEETEKWRATFESMKAASN
ncbi:MAG TPA: tripartite tricarboxylate transporter substrate binding protein [Burkholderiaceae bacterium]|nr:tripartite tricarboxylate transporter substrate binding protein [Burkholderiaceae bacterium]